MHDTGQPRVSKCSRSRGDSSDHSRAWYYITQDIIKVDGRYLRTKTGIPQGSVLSVLLCGLFYAHLENHLLRPALPLGPFGPMLSQGPPDNVKSRNIRSAAAQARATAAAAPNEGKWSTHLGTSVEGKRRRTSSSSNGVEDIARSQPRRRMQLRART